MKKLLLAAAAAVLLTTGAGAAIAAPGPNGRNDFGLCKAYFAGSETGQANKRTKGPFPALEAAADEAGDGNGETTAEEMQAFCDAALPGGGGGGEGAPGKP